MQTERNNAIFQQLIKPNQVEQKQAVVEAPASEVEKPSDFEGYLRSILTPDAENNVNEETLFAGLLQERIRSSKGDELASKFEMKYKEGLEQFRRPDGVTLPEGAARQALRSLVDSGDLSQEEAHSFHAQAFHGAQLDNRLNVLWDGRGSVEDPSIAIANLEAALLSARTKIEAFDNGSEDPGSLSLDAEPGSEFIFGVNGSDKVFYPHEHIEFGALAAPEALAALLNPQSEMVEEVEEEVLAEEETPESEEEDQNLETLEDAIASFGRWNPNSSRNNNLVVSAPSELSAQIEKVVLRDSEGNEIEEGTLGKINKHGRQRVRFDKEGAEYGQDVRVEVSLKDGTTASYEVGEAPHKRKRLRQKIA
ncbi:MAG: hypothetical protein KDD53_04620 [Bdellovibrionales bacterium]|nr:hypothetical protein [Bdellovibrionales bacterium]